MASEESQRLSEEELLGQMGVLTFAAMDTTSNALSRILHLLAGRPDVQRRLRAELAEAQGGGRADIPYDGLVKLPYLDAVCRETLRLYVRPLSSDVTASR